MRGHFPIEVDHAGHQLLEIVVARADVLGQGATSDPVVPTDEAALRAEPEGHETVVCKDDALQGRLRRVARGEDAPARRGGGFRQDLLLKNAHSS